MSFYVYMLLSKIKERYVSYVGYTKDINHRVLLHNNSKGAKFTKGNYWKIIYKKKYLTKRKAMSEEYKLKKDYKRRSLIKYEYIKKLS